MLAGGYCSAPTGSAYFTLRLTSGGAPDPAFSGDGWTQIPYGEGDHLLETALELSAGKHQPSPTRLTFESNVPTDTQHEPLETATWVRFPQSNNIARPEFEWSVRIDGHAAAIVSDYIRPGIFIPPVRAPSLSALRSVAFVIAS